MKPNAKLWYVVRYELARGPKGQIFYVHKHTKDLRIMKNDRHATYKSIKVVKLFYNKKEAESMANALNLL